MKRKTIMILLIILLSFLFCGCEKQECTECITTRIGYNVTKMETRIFCDLSRSELKHYEKMNTYKSGHLDFITICE